MVGMERLEVLMRNRRMQWAASVYSRNESELGLGVHRILREELGPEVVLR